MVLNDILADCALKLGYAGSVDFTEPMTGDARRIFDKLIRCAGLVYGEIITDYLPLIKRESVVFDNGALEISALSGRMLYVIGIRRGGVSKRFRLFSTYIETVFSGEGEIEYACLPEPLTGQSEIDARLPEWLFAEGICAEYCFAENLADMAAAFQTKFREGISKLRRRDGRVYVKARGWY